MSSWGDYQPYVTVAEKKRRAQKKLAQLRKKNPHIQPVVVKNNKLTTTWWGSAWNKNLQNYADYDNRIGRGRSYVRYGAVLDLQITSGTIRSLVHGSNSAPYRVTINIKTLANKKWQQLQRDCQGLFSSLQPLLAGKFPKQLATIFTDRHTGIFPDPKEISFKCSCPDPAYMCKHVAATLYGVGTRLDSQPELFFTLRGVKIDELVNKAVKEKKENLLQKAQRKSSRVIADSDLSELFGIEIEDIQEFIDKQLKNEQTQRASESVTIVEKLRNKVHVIPHGEQTVTILKDSKRSKHNKKKGPQLQ